MQDVGRLAGVSVATVSAVVNGKAIVSQELTERVTRAIRMLNYKPDMLARSLRMQKSHVLGMVMPQIASPFYAEVLRGVEDEARENGYSILIADSRGDPQEEEEQLTTLISRRVDGVILAPVNLQSLAYQLLEPNLPVVLFDRFPPGYEGSVVMVDNLAASRRATICLIEAGHERIAMITGTPGILTAEERAQGVRDALGEFGLSLPPEYIRSGSFTMQEGYQAAMSLMRLPTPPSAIFSHNHEMTLGLMRALKELKIPCPAQISVIGFDDFVVGADGFSWATLFSPQISCIAQPSYRIGREAATILIRKMTKTPNEDGPPEKVLRLEAELRLRESVASPARAGIHPKRRSSWPGL